MALPAFLKKIIGNKKEEMAEKTKPTAAKKPMRTMAAKKTPAKK